MEQTFNVISVNKIETPSITRDSAKEWCRIDTDAEDALIDKIIVMAYDLVRDYTSRTLIKSEMMVAFLPNRELLLPYQPIIDVMAVFGDSGALVLNQDYKFNGMDTITVLTPQQNGIGVNYQAGEQVESPEVHLVVLNTIAMLYEHRGDAGVDISTIKGINKLRMKIWI